MTTVEDSDAKYLPDRLGRHEFESAETGEARTWLDAHRRASGGDVCTCGLPRANKRHKKIKSPRRDVLGQVPMDLELRDLLPTG